MDPVINSFSSVGRGEDFFLGLDCAWFCSPVCILTKHVYLLNTTLSTMPATKKHPNRTRSAHFGSTSEVKRECKREDRDLLACGNSELGGVDVLSSFRVDWSVSIVLESQ